MTTRAQVVSQARSYLFTKFEHQGRQRGAGIDCVGLLLCVFEDLKCLDKHGKPLLRTDYMNYAPRPKGRFVYDLCNTRLNLKQGDYLPGDILVINIPLGPVHLGFATSIGLIHASMTGKVAEHLMNASWQRRIEGIFEIPGIQAG